MEHRTQLDVTTILSRLGSLSLLALGFGTVLYGMFLAISWRTGIPISDQLPQLSIVRTVIERGFSEVAAEDWFSLHAGAHRIVFLRLAMVIDYQWFGGQNSVIHAVAALSLACLAACYCRFALRTTTHAYTLAAGAGLIFFWLFSPSQLHNWVLPTNNSWFVAHGLITLAIYLVLAQQSLTWKRSSAAILLCSSAALTTFSGVPALVCLLALICVRDWRLGLWCSLPIVALLTGLTYGMQSGAASIAQYAPEFYQQFSVWQLGLGYLKGVGQYLSAPLSIHQPWIGAGLVAASILLLLIICIRAMLLDYCHGNDSQRFQVFCAACALIGLGIAFANSMGRSVFADPTAAKYQSYVCFYWLNISLLVWIHWGMKPLCQALLILLILVFLALSSPAQKSARHIAHLAETFTDHGRQGDFESVNYRRLLANDKYDYYRQYDDFFEAHDLAYHR